jgi:hypothetical protein
MSDDNLSLLTTLRPNYQDKSSYLEVWNPEKDQIDFSVKEDFSSLEKIHTFLNKIKANLDHTHRHNDLYSHWLNRGWNKSIDYYVASRQYEGYPSISQSNNYPTKKITINLQCDAKTHSLPQAILQRRTKRLFEKQTLPYSLFFSGINNAIHSIGCSIHGFQLHFIIYDIENIQPGVYRYDHELQALSLIREGLFIEEMSANIQGMHTPKTACFTIILVTDFDSLLKGKPYPNGLRETYIEAGRIAQKLIISYMEYDIYSLVTPALKDKKTSSLLSLKEPDFSPLYSLTFGYPK